MSYPFNKLTFTGSKPMTSAVLGVSLAAVGTAIYLSPSQDQNRSTAPPGSSTAQASPSQSSRGATSSATPTIKPSKSPSAPGRKPGNTQFRVIRPPATTDVVIVKQPSTKVVNSEQGATGATKTCTDFTWQQDAQAAYAANLSDPWGLDGKPGPHNDDGLACTQLPRDPAGICQVK
jgi:mannan endo-1,4-beta-mannosidase